MNKTNNILTPFIIGLATLVASVNAQAQSANDQTTDPTNWAVGAGATFSGGPQGCSPAILLGFYSQVPDCATGISFALERKLSTNLSLVGQLSGHYASNQNSSQYSEGSSDASQYVNKSASIAMGPHWTFNPKSKVSFGTFLMLGAGYATSSRSPETKTSSSSLSGTQAQALNGSQSSIGGIANVSPINYDTQQVTGYSVSGVAGITVDAELTKNLSLRIAANVLRANYQVLKTEYKSSNSAATQSHEESGFRADFGFEPSIALRLTF